MDPEPATDRVPRPHPQTQVDVFKPIETNYRQLRDGRAAFLARKPPPAQIDEYADTLAAARDAYWKAVADALADRNPFVLRIRDDLQKANRRVAKELNDLRDIAGFLSVITESTRLAAALARLAAI